MLHQFTFGLGVWVCLISAASADAPKLKWSALTGDGYSGKLRQAVMDFTDIGPLKISVYLPPHYKAPTKYPVLYVVDGQNLFEGEDGSWKLDETLEELTNAKKMKEIVVVGIHTGLLAKPGNHGFDRMHWFVPKKTFSVDDKAWQGGGAPQFLGKVLELKSVIDHDFSTDSKDAGIMGSSLGGVFAQYAGFKRSDVFRHIAIMSPSAWLQNRQQQGTEEWHPAHAPWPKFIWMDMGTHEGDLPNKQGVWKEHPADSTRFLEAAKKDAVWIEKQPETDNGTKFRYTPYDPRDQEHVPARHNEASWAVRVKDALPFLYPP